MSVLKITGENFESEVINSDKKVIVDFYAEWCAPCKMMSPIIDDIAEELDGKIKVGKVNTDENIELAQRFEIMSIPTILIFEKGKIIKTFVGLTDKTSILSEIN